MMTDQIRIRRATQHDREALCEIQVSAIRQLGRTCYSEDELEAWSHGLTPQRYEKPISEHHVIVAESRSTVVAFGTLDCTTGKVIAVYVRPCCARQGIGARALTELLREARKRGLQEVHCESSLCAAAFYQNAGFESGDKRKHRFRDGTEIDCIPMTKPLS